MAYTYGQGLSNTGAAYNLWGTPASAPNPYYTQGPTYTKGLYDYSPQQAEAQQQGPSSPSIDRTGMEDMTAKQAAWWAERMGLGGLLRYGSTDGSGVPIEDIAVGSPSYPNTAPPSIMNPYPFQEYTVPYGSSEDSLLGNNPDVRSETINEDGTVTYQVESSPVDPRAAAFVNSPDFDSNYTNGTIGSVPGSNPYTNNIFQFEQLNSQFPEANRDYYINEIDFSSPEIRGAYAEDHYSNVFEQPTVYDPFDWF
jgi:hypothetical protein